MKQELDLSVIIPVKGNATTIHLTVETLLAQQFRGTFEVIVVVDRADPGYEALKDLVGHPQLVIIHPDKKFPFSGRDANWRRTIGLRAAKGDIRALTDADMFFAPDWIQRGADLLSKQGLQCVAGIMRSAYQDGFWGKYADMNLLGAKTPRFYQPYMLTLENFGMNGSKPGITANMFITRDLLANVGYPRDDFLHNDEDYAFFYDIVSHGYCVLCTPELVGNHYHRQGWGDLIKEYKVSGRGCGDFVRVYPDAPFSQRRLSQLVLIAAAVAFGLFVTVANPLLAMSLLLAGFLVLGMWSAAKIHRIEGLLFPAVTFILGLGFSWGIGTQMLWGHYKDFKQDNLNVEAELVTVGDQAK